MAAALEWEEKAAAKAAAVYESAGRMRNLKSEYNVATRKDVRFVAKGAPAWLAAETKVLALLTGAGEIDIIALRRGRVAFVEVKRRSDLAAAEASVSSRQRQRIHRAADLWLAHHASYQTCQMGFDLIFVLPWRLPKHLPDAL